MPITAAILATHYTKVSKFCPHRATGPCDGIPIAPALHPQVSQLLIIRGLNEKIEYPLYEMRIIYSTIREPGICQTIHG